jgi:stearoyl-CoA desaturase (Delta-9 desaturase)
VSVVPGLVGDGRAGEPVRDPSGICWQVLIPYAGMYLACLALPFYGVSWRAVWLLAVSFFVRMFFLSAGYHRYFAHRAFQTSRPVQFLLGLFGALTIQGGPLWWAQTHRQHHRHTDTPQDLHSPTHYGLLYAHFGWFLRDRFYKIDYARIPDLAKYAELRWLDSELRVVLYLAYGWLVYWLGGIQGLLWGFCLSTVLLWNISHWVQSFSHAMGGYRRYQSNDHSRNHFLIGVLSLGEWHNNHHHAPSSARQGQVWWEIDVTYYVLKVLSWVGLVWNLRQFERSPGA